MDVGSSSSSWYISEEGVGELVRGLRMRKREEF